MAASLIVTVRSAVIDGLDALAALNGVTVSFAWKLGDKGRERIFTRRARFTHGNAALKAGRNFRDESGEFDLVILVEGVGLSQEATSERALALGLVVEEWIADRKSNALGITGLQYITVNGGGELNEMFNDRGHLAELVYPIRYQARLT